MGHKKGIVFALMSALLIGMAFLGSPAYAEEVESSTGRPVSAGDECTPLDVVFLIDQSTDMEDNDPNGMRLEIAKWMIGVLQYERLLKCPEVVHTVSVVNFGGSNFRFIKQLTLQEKGLIEIAVNPTSLDSDSITVANQSLKTIWSSPKLVQKDLQQRNYSEALDFIASSDELSTWVGKRIIIMLTANGGIPCDDGKACPGDIFALDPVKKGQYQVPDDLTTQQKEECVNLLADQEPDTAYLLFQRLNCVIKNKLPFAGENVGPYLYNITLKSRGDDFLKTPKDFENFQNVWNDVLDENGGYIKEVETHIQMAKEVMNIYNLHNPDFDYDELPVSSVPEVPPLTQHYLVTYFSRSGTKLGGMNPRGTSDSPVMNTRWEENNHQDFYWYPAPLSGQWTWSPSSEMLVYEMKIPVGELVVETMVPEDASALPQYNEGDAVSDPRRPYYLKVKLSDEEETAWVKEIGGESVNAEVEITFPVSGGKVTYDLTFDPAEGMFISDNPVPVHEIGNFEYTVSVTRPDGVMLTESGGYPVDEVTAFKLNILSVTDSGAPEDDEAGDIGQGVRVHGSWWRGSKVEQPVSIKVQLLGLGDEELDAKEIFKKPNESVRAYLEIVDAEGTTGEAAPVWLTTTGTDSILSGSIEEEQLSQISSDLNKNNEYLLTLQVDGETKTSYRISEADHPVELPFKRQDSILQMRWVFQGINYLGIALALGAIGFGVYMVAMPLKGTLYFYRPGGEEPFDHIAVGGRFRKRTFRENKLESMVASEEISPLLSHFKEIEVEQKSDSLKISFDAGNKASQESKEPFILEGGKENARKISGGIIVEYER